MGAVYIHQGDLERGLQCCNKALAFGPLPYDAAMAKALRGYGKSRKAESMPASPISVNQSPGSRALACATPARYALWLAEGHLRRSDHAAARSLIKDVLETSRTMGYLHYEGLACWLTGECLAPEAPAVAEPYVESAIDILERICPLNDVARAMVTRAALHQAAGDVATARGLLDQAFAIFQT